MIFGDGISDWQLVVPLPSTNREIFIKLIYFKSHLNNQQSIDLGLTVNLSFSLLIGFSMNFHEREAMLRSKRKF